jgi:hypothetical protein
MMHLIHVATAASGGADDAQIWTICMRPSRPAAQLSSAPNRRSEQFGSIQADGVVTLGESQAGQRALPLTMVRQAIQWIMVLCGDK